MNDSWWNKIWQFSIWTIVMVFTVAWFFVLILPAFLPLIRKHLEAKYEGFQYKENLVNEEMTKYVIGTCILSIVGWLLFIYVALHPVP